MRRGDNIYKRKDNRWEGRYPCGYNKEGKTRYKSVYGHTYAEVKEKLNEIKQQSAQNVNHSNMTVKKLFDEWLIKISSHTKESTTANYRMKINKHILPEFGGMKYDLLNASMIYSFIQKKLKLGLSAKYVSDILIVFKSMAKYMNREYGYHNPLVNVSLPKSNKKSAVRILEPGEQNKLSEYLRKNMNLTSLGIFISLYTGLRIGELCALKWSDIDFKKSILSVRRTIQRISTENSEKATRLLITAPKTQSSVRNIPIPSGLIRLLEKFKESGECFVLSGNSVPVEPRTMQYRFSSILKKACLPSVNFHSLRHLFATNCIRLGFDIKSLSEILGHSSVETTLNRYVHSSIEQKRVCMEKLVIAV